MELDRDLRSIQEVRNLLKNAHSAQKKFKEFSQEQVDKIIKAMVEAGQREASKLALLAVEETKFGVHKDKIVKNLVATRDLYNYIKDMKTVGVIKKDEIRKIYEIAEPMGIIAGIIPSTNPTSTALYKIIISIKARNAIILSPHPAAVKCINETARIMNEAAIIAGAPKGLIGCMSIATMSGTNELMHHNLTSMILATGGSALVKAAYSAGKPALGVGPGNVPAFIERSADIPKAVKDIINSKTFDNGTVCASEQAIVCDAPIKDKVISELKRNGAYFLSQIEQDKITSILINPNGRINASIVGQSATHIAQMAGIQVPINTKVLIAELDCVGKNCPLSMEKLSPILAFYTENGWENACKRCIELLNFGGIGHSLVIHSRNMDIIMEFGLKKPVFRVLVNTPSSQGAVGATTGLAPALTLGCGTWGGSATSDNITPMNLINIKRLAFDLEDSLDFNSYNVNNTNNMKSSNKVSSYHTGTEQLHNLSSEDIQNIVEEFLKERKKG